MQHLNDRICKWYSLRKQVFRCGHHNTFYGSEGFGPSRNFLKTEGSVQLNLVNPSCRLTLRLHTPRVHLWLVTLATPGVVVLFTDCLSYSFTAVSRIRRYRVLGIQVDFRHKCAGLDISTADGEERFFFVHVLLTKRERWDKVGDA